MGPKARVGGGGRKDNGAVKGPRNGIARRRRWKKAREGSETGDSGEAMITGYHRGDHPTTRRGQVAGYTDCLFPTILAVALRGYLPRVMEKKET